MSANGYLTDAELAPITGGTQLANAAAAAWNAAAVEIHNSRGLWIAINGADSGYRPYARQVYWRNYWCGQGACQNAAVPGTSNHGLGLAADCPSWVVDALASVPQFGWVRTRCSDAPWEPWHVKWCGGWSGRDPGPYGSGGGPVHDKYPTLKKGDHGGAVKRAQRHLDTWNVGLKRPSVDGDFGDGTRTAVIQFQTLHGLGNDGVIGNKTWHKLRQTPHLHSDELFATNHIQWWRHTHTHPESVHNAMDWCLDRAHQIYNQAQIHGWDHDHRGERFKRLRRFGGKRV